MSYDEQWRALAGRIRGLVHAGQLHAQYLSSESQDPYGMAKGMRVHLEDLLSGLKDYREQYQHALPPSAVTAIDRFINKQGPLIRDNSGSPGAKNGRVKSALVLLCAFETEMSYFLSDIQERIRARSDLAFSHLQRLIVADTEVQQKWMAAFEKSEPFLEKLGAVHLLHHGIWAFKVNGQGARTDLVYQEPAGDLINEQRFANGLVLTEWKKASTGDNPENLFARARAQAQLYAEGVLSGIELRTYRYAVVVSRRHVTVPDDLAVGGVIYRHINVAVDPETPSRQAKR